MRLFIGVFLPEEVTTHLNARLRSSPALPQLRWTQPSSLHITLKFIGQTDEGNASIFQPILEKVATRHKTFKLWCEGGGIFPNRKNPRVFWTGVKGEVDILKRIAGNLETEFGLLGFPPENRRFSPHLTLARLDRVDPPVDQLENLLKDYKSPEFEVDTIHLVQSQLTPQKARYHVLSSHKLGNLTLHEA